MNALSIMVAAALLLAAPQFKSRVEIVRIDVLATSGGKPVTGLTAADFEVRDNGVLQQVRLSDAGVSQLDVILALDMSASLTTERLGQLRAASEALLEQLRSDDRAALVTFDQAVMVRRALSSDFTAIRAALREGKRGSRTSLMDAMYAGLALAERGDRRTLLLTFSDGVDTSSWLEPETVIDVAKQSSTVVYGVSTSAPSATPALLREIAHETGGEVLDGTSRKLETAFTAILDEFRQRYLLTFSPDRMPSPGWHKLEVRVKRRGVTVKTRSGYFVPSDPRTQLGPIRLFSRSEQRRCRRCEQKIGSPAIPVFKLPYADVTLAGARKPYLAELTAVPLLIIEDVGMRTLAHTAAEDFLELILDRLKKMPLLRRR
jgi:Ca-activated chloride channel family protein